MNIILSNSSGEPIYQQITDQIKAMIVTGQMTEGELLTSIRQLAKDLRISVITTKRAYEELERDGFIQSVPGRGSFVAPQNCELVRENQLRKIEEKFLVIIAESRLAHLSLEELTGMLQLLYEEDKI